ncbi:MAG: Xaa-Pro peptidase family protein [Bacillota bacterium]
MIHRQRVARVQDLARREGVAAVALMPGPNLFYLTGVRMHLSERPALLFVPAAGEPFGVCPGFEAERLRQAGVARLYPWGEEEGPLPAFRRALAESGLGGARLAVEYRQMRVLELELLRAAAPGLSYTDAGPLMAALRSVKDEEEVARLQRAAALCDAGMAAAREAIRPGVTEAEVEAYIARALERLGARGPLEIMVASGPRSAIPHAATSDRVLQEGDLCWVDLVLTVDGYVGDITRTFPVGRATGQAREIYQVVLEAQAAARAAARPGITGAELDGVAREVIARRGYGEYFTHRTGHGIGLEVHEDPYVVGSNQQPLVPGNVVTIEPGIYIPGLGGVRIEDDVLITPEGARVLTQYPRDLLGE